MNKANYIGNVAMIKVTMVAKEIGRTDRLYRNEVYD